ncbi:MAG: hypothetical protein C3F13_13765 [Anaerolineales bacterium]|nr:hypothetical protein [Anaerolineae bacterium]PWB51504.1 MAG: hypothetical protein C3F13_13765 [Anaerolineales bacterium]
MQDFSDNPYILAAFVAAGLLISWLARTVYKNKPAGCKWLTIAFGCFMWAGLLFILIFLYLYEHGILK